MPGSDQARAIIQQLRQLDYSETTLSRSDWEFSSTTPYQRTVLASYQADVPYAIRPNEDIDIAIPAHQKVETDGEGDAEYELDAGLVENPSVGDDVVLYDDGDRAYLDDEDVDYADDTIAFDDGGSSTTLDVFHMTDEQAELRLRIAAPKNVHHEPISVDVGVLTLRDSNKDPVQFSASHELEGVVPKNFTLEWHLDAPYVAKFETDRGARADNMLLRLPVRQGARPVTGLKELKKAATR